MKTLFIILFSSVLLTLNTNAQTDSTLFSCDSGKQAADSAISKNVLFRYLFGDGIDIGYANVLRVEYNIETQHKGCIVLPYYKCFNEKMDEEIFKRYGENIYEQASKRKKDKKYQNVIPQQQPNTKSSQMLADTLIYGDTLGLADRNILKENSKIIVFSNDSNYLVFSSQDLFIKNLKNWLKEHDIDSDKRLLEFMTNQNTDTIHIGNQKLTESLMSRIEYRWANMIETHQCLIYNKTVKALEKSIRIEHYLISNHAGKRYILPNERAILSIETGVF